LRDKPAVGPSVGLAAAALGEEVVGEAGVALVVDVVVEVGVALAGMVEVLVGDGAGVVKRCGLAADVVDVEVVAVLEGVVLVAEFGRDVVGDPLVSASPFAPEAAGDVVAAGRFAAASARIPAAGEPVKWPDVARTMTRAMGISASAQIPSRP
jgi:hypothetical protein